MSRRSVHYEAAFEDYLRARGWPFVVVDDARKAILADASIKSFDYIVYSAVGANLLVDVKGRKFPDPCARAGSGTCRAWENWVTEDDVNGLEQWQRVFGEGFRGALVFAYWLQGPPHLGPFEEVHFHEGRSYAFRAIELDAYAAIARPRSRRWKTLAAPVRAFRQHARDVAEML